MIKAFVFDAYGTIYDVRSVGSAVEAAFPGRGEFITALWRQKQLEYSWLRSMMGRYADFATVTRDALAYALGTLGLDPAPSVIEKVAAAFDALHPYPEAEAALTSLSAYRLAVLSNGSPAMLTRLVGQSGLGRFFEAVLSVDPMRVFKPDPRAYAPIRDRLALKPEEVVFVSSNGFDVAGAKAVGFRVARVERLSAPALRATLGEAAPIGPKTMVDALRTQADRLGQVPDVVVGSLAELLAVAATLA